MRSRVAAALLVAVTLAACGGASTPTQPSVALPSDTLTSGSYRLFLTMSATGESVCTGNVCFSTSLCMSAPGAPLIGVTAPIDVHVERTDTAITIRPADPSATFRMSLQLSGTTLTGTASGGYGTGGNAVAVSGATLDTPATVTGVIVPTVGGTLAGSITIGGSGCSNNGHHWSLGPRFP